MPMNNKIYAISDAFWFRVEASITEFLVRQNKNISDFSVKLKFCDHYCKDLEHFAYRTSVHTFDSEPVCAFISAIGNDLWVVVVASDVQDQVVRTQKLTPPSDLVRLMTINNKLHPYEDPMKAMYTYIDFSGLDTSWIEDFSYLLAGCFQLIHLTLEIDTSKAKTMNSAFAGCHNLRFIDLSLFDTSRVLDMERMFFGCCSLYRIWWNFAIDPAANTKEMFDFCFSINPDCKQRAADKGIEIRKNRLRNKERLLEDYYSKLSVRDFEEIENDPLFVMANSFLFRCGKIHSSLLVKRFDIPKERAIRLACGIEHYNDQLCRMALLEKKKDEKV